MWDIYKVFAISPEVGPSEGTYNDDHKLFWPPTKTIPQYASETINGNYILANFENYPRILPSKCYNTRQLNDKRKQLSQSIDGNINALFTCAAEISSFIENNKLSSDVTYDIKLSSWYGYTTSTSYGNINNNDLTPSSSNNNGKLFSYQLI